MYKLFTFNSFKGGAKAYQSYTKKTGLPYKGAHDDNLEHYRHVVIV